MAADDRGIPDRPPPLGPHELSRIFSVEEFPALALARMGPEVYDVVEGGAGTGWTIAENRAAFGRWVFRPRVLIDVDDVSLGTSVLGTPIDIPILFAPSASHRLAHPDGELATARAARRLNTIQVLSTYSSVSLEDVAGEGAHRWLQLYWFTDRGVTQDLVERAAAAGYGAITVTVDAARLAWRDGLLRAPFVLPAGIGEPNVPDRPLDVDAALTWDSLAWLRSVSPLPIVLKGIVRPDDAHRAIDAGVAAIVVSNHGGRQVDGCVASLEALGPIVDAVASEIEVLLDGGVRRGTDVLKALAIGARAVLLGRSVQWGLAAGGEPGVVRILDLIVGELRSAIALCGCRSIGEVSPAILRRNPDPVHRSD